MYKPTLETTRSKRKDTNVIVCLTNTFGEKYYTRGRLTGNTGPHDESFELILPSPLVEADKDYFHYEDLYEDTDENFYELCRNQH